MPRKNFMQFALKVNTITDKNFHYFTIPGTKFKGWYFPVDAGIHLDLWENKVEIEDRNFKNSGEMFDHLKALVKNTGKRVW